jgi:hypothetical protein
MTGPGTEFLRRTLTPYVGQSVIIIGVTILLTFVAQKKAQWGLLWAAGLIWALFISYLYLFALKYRVYWNSDSVTMCASGGPNKSIRFDEITGVRYETARANEFLAQARPFRRFVVTGRRNDLNERIDISLRHFRGKDIDHLLAVIRERRPDLAFPNDTMRKVRVR